MGSVGSVQCQIVHCSGLYFFSRSTSEVTQSCPNLCNPMDCSLSGSSVHGVFQARVLEWISHFLLQAIFLTQELNPGLLHCGQMLYRLSHQGNPLRLVRKTLPSTKTLKGQTGKTYFLWLIHIDVWQKSPQYCNYPQIKVY